MRPMTGRRRIRGCSCLEVDAHHDPAEGRVTGLGEPGGGKDAAAADAQLVPGDLLPGLRDHRVALEGPSAALPRESTAARASARLIPRRRKPARVTKQVTAQTLSSVLSSARPAHGTRPRRT